MGVKAVLSITLLFLPTVRRPVERQRPAGASSVREATKAAGQVRTWVTRLGFVKMSGPSRKRPASLRQQSACLGW